MVDVMGATAATLSLVCVLLGLPSQIAKNYRRKSCEGLALPFYLIAFFSYASWIVYGVSKPDPFLCISQGPGSVLMLVILVQFYIYRDKKKEDIIDAPL